MKPTTGLPSSTGRPAIVPRRRSAIVVGLIVLAGCATPGAPPSPTPARSPAAAVERSRGTPSTSAAAAAGDLGASYVGAAACASCHPAETERWRASHHHRAMQPATAATVRGDFGDATFTKDGITSTFSRRDGAYVVRTDGPDGRLHDYPVAYTFGAVPLQQYLVAMPNGRFQALGIAWDTRPKDAGGQRWFHLHPEERIDHGDQLHWTGAQQNWNFMCAECHSTHLEKGYDAGADRFTTTWTDVDVACEACHGPGSGHVAWAEATRAAAAATPPTAPPADPFRGLAFRLTDGADGRWTFAPGASIAHRTPALASRVEVETCGRCHARRAQLFEDDADGTALAHAHRVALLDEHLYAADGQIQDEVYEYGSFLQSRMYAVGVTCSDCHDPHSGSLREAGNALCATCHLATRYDGPQHHGHTSGTPGVRCVACHMPERLYMVVDGRRDHAFRVPRPDLSARLGTPNPCTDCHRDKTPTWAAATIAARKGPDWTPPWHWAEAIHAGRSNAADAEALLMRAIGDDATPPIARATALALLGGHLGPQSLPLVEHALGDADPLVRRAAVAALGAVPPAMRAPLVTPLLRDPVRTVRIEALGALLDVPRHDVPADDLAPREAVVREYRAAQAFNADRAEARTNLGMLERRLGNGPKAVAALEAALRLDPSFMPAYVELADLRREQGNEADAETILRGALAVDPAAADVHEALGLSLVRQRRMGDALPELRKAAELDPESVRHAYVLAVALHDTGDARAAIAVLEAAHERHPGARELLAALAQYNAESGDHAAARRWQQLLTARAAGTR